MSVDFPRRPPRTREHRPDRETTRVPGPCALAPPRRRHAIRRPPPAPAQRRRRTGPAVPTRATWTSSAVSSASQRPRQGRRRRRERGRSRQPPPTPAAPRGRVHSPAAPRVGASSSPELCITGTPARTASVSKAHVRRRRQCRGDGRHRYRNIEAFERDRLSDGHPARGGPSDHPVVVTVGPRATT